MRSRLADDGQILVDKSRKFQEEKGEWENPAVVFKTLILLHKYYGNFTDRLKEAFKALSPAKSANTSRKARFIDPSSAWAFRIPTANACS